MKLRNHCIQYIIASIIFCLSDKQLHAQLDCTLKAPVIKIDFGSGNSSGDINIFRPAKYRRDQSSCPIDGEYSYSSSTTDCFIGDWFTLNEDHTENDHDGRMMLVNASITGGVFLTTPLTGFSPNTLYELSQWMMNVC